MNFEQTDSSSQLEKSEAIEKINEKYLPSIREAEEKGEDPEVYFTFLKLLNHIKRHGLMDEDLPMPLREIIKERAIFFLSYAQKLRNRSGCKTELERMEHCLKEGNLTYEDIGTTAEEITKLAKSAEKH